MLVTRKAKKMKEKKRPSKNNKKKFNEKLDEEKLSDDLDRAENEGFPMNDIFPENEAKEKHNAK